MTGTMPIIGYRTNGAPIHLIQGGADDDGGDPTPVPAAPPPGPAALAAPPATADDSTALRAELEQARAQLAQFLAIETNPQTPPPDDDEGDSGKPESDVEKERMRKALNTYKAEAKAKRVAFEKLQSDIKARDEAAKARDEAAQRELAEAQRVAEAAEKARADAVAQYKPSTIKGNAVPAFLAAGAKPDRADRLVRLLDMAALDVDASGEVTGLAEQIAAVKADWPELFLSDEPERKQIPRVATGDRAPVQDAPTRSADILARQVLGGAA